MKKTLLTQEHVWAILVHEQNKLIDSIGLNDDPKRTVESARTLGCAIAEQYWGNGFATEATHTVISYGFDRLALDVISAYCYPSNHASKRVFEKCGLVYDGTLRVCERPFGDQALDNLCFSLTRAEYLAMQQAP